MCMKRVLFVDDDPGVLQGLRRMLHAMRDMWHMEFVQSADDAKRVLASENFDVIVTDMRMPGLDGAALLAFVQDHYPHMVRIVLSGQADMESILRTVGPSHQYLAKPCDADTLRKTVDRACSLSSLLAREELKGLIARVGSLPSLPSVYAELVQELASEDASIQRIGQIVSKDVAMSAKILQLVNSAFFGLPRHVGSPAQAAALLGTETLRALVLSVHVFSQYEAGRLPGVNLEQLWHHSSRTSVLAKRIAEAESAGKRCVEDAFIAGFLHAAGTMVLASGLQIGYLDAKQLAEEESVPLWEAEVRRLGASHGEVGGYLLGLWGLPNPVVEAVAYHDNPNDSEAPGFTPLTAVHAACALCCEADEAEGASVAALDYDYLDREGLSHRLDVWRGLADESRQQENAA
ncbi:MAG: hypothetical protein AMXMBFR61_11400 [Fimbriimonadales bacterium]